MANTRGKEVINEMGEKAYMLDDGYRVLDDIKGTPRYWKKTKYEMIAKLDNLGPFNLFFTLSCADMRWDENFASILQEKGYRIRYNVVKDDEGNWDTVVEAKKIGDDKYKPVDLRKLPGVRENAEPFFCDAHNKVIVLSGIICIQVDSVRL